MIGKIAVAALISIMTMSSYALERSGPEMSLDRLASESDDIFVGNVVNKKASFYQQNIYTQYTLQVEQPMKGRYGKGETVVVNQAGGTLQSPPIAQHPIGSPEMFHGERVALFLKQPLPRTPAEQKRNPDPAGVLSSPQIVGFNQGKFTVVHDKQSDRDVVFRFRPEQNGFLYSDKIMQQVSEAVASHEIKTTSESLLRTADPATPVYKKDPLEATSQDAAALKQGSAQGTAFDKRTAGNVTEIPIQDLASFEAQVNAAVNR
jgi:hypothetical protein